MISEERWTTIRRLADDLAALARLREATDGVDALVAEDLAAVSEAMLDDIALRIAELRQGLRQ